MRLRSVCNTGERGDISLYLLHSRQASGSWRSHRRKQAFSLSLFCVPPSLIACSLPEQTTDSHRTEFVFDVRQVWCFAESPVTLLYPPTQSFTEQLKTTSKKSHKVKEKKLKGEKKNQSYSPPKSTILLKCKMCHFFLFKYVVKSQWDFYHFIQ